VGQHVAEEGIEAGGEVIVGHGDRTRTVRELRLDPAILFFGQHRPERQPIPRHLAEVARHVLIGDRRSAGLADELGDCPFEFVDIGRQAVTLGRIGQRVAVQSQRRDRGAETVGEIGDQFAFGLQQLGDSVGQPVQGLADLDDLGRPGGLDPSRQVSPAQLLGGRGQLAHRQHDRAGQPIGDGDGDGDQPEAERSEQQPRRRDPLGERGGRHGDGHDRHRPTRNHDRHDDLLTARHLGGEGFAPAGGHESMGPGRRLADDLPI
jgi:hypothetical protein